jgi:SAM-dependent methyltransferase
MPVYVNFLHRTRVEAADCPRGDIILVACRDCGFISNAAFDPDRLVYGEGYENSLHCTETFQAYAESLVDRLIQDFRLNGKTMVEIGCGSGEFLNLLCERGDNRGVGFDPSHMGPAEGQALSEKIRIIRDVFSAASLDVEPDFVCCRHTLEHIQDPFELLRPLRRSLMGRPDTPVFFEVPNGAYTLRHCFIWDIIYEHPTYFTDQSLQRVFECAGFNVKRTYESFGGQFLCIEAFCSANEIAPEKVSMRSRKGRDPSLANDLKTFESGREAYVSGWKREFEKLETKNRTVVLWGAGSKGITFLNMLDQRGFVDYVVDINPKKNGMFVAGTGQMIVSPERLGEVEPDIVIIANPIYRDEIETMVRGLGVNTALLSL